MKRLLVMVLVLPLVGCLGFEETYYEDGGLEWRAPDASFGCPSRVASEPPLLTSPTSVSQMPAAQTREPDLVSRP